MIYYSEPNIAAATKAKSAYPTNIYLPLNTGRTVPGQVTTSGASIDAPPANSIELTAWANASIKLRRIIPNFLPVRTVSSAYTAVPTTDAIFIVSTSATITLPNPATYAGWTFHVRSLAGVTTTLSPASGQIDNASGLGATTTVAANATATYTTDGTNYYKVS